MSTRDPAVHDRRLRRGARRPAGPAAQHPLARAPNSSTTGRRARRLSYVQDVCEYWASEYDWRAREAALNRFDQFTIAGRRARRSAALRPRPLAASRRDAAVDHARLAGLDRRVPQGDRAAHRTRRCTVATPRTRSTSSRRRCPASGSRASRPTTGWGVEQDRRAVRRADGLARLRPLRRPGRRLGLGGHHGDRWDRHRPLRRRPRHPRHGCPSQDRRRARRRRNSGPSTGSSTTATGTRATPSSSRPVRRRSATDWSTRPRRRPPGSSRSSGRGPTATATPSTCSTRDELLDNVMLYWINGNGASSARIYWESFGKGPRPAPVTIPSGFTVVPEGDRAAGAPLGRGRVHRHPLLERAARRAATSPRSRSPTCSSTTCAPASASSADRSASAGNSTRGSSDEPPMRPDR